MEAVGGAVYSSSGGRVGSYEELRYVAGALGGRGDVCARVRAGSGYVGEGM